MKKHFKTYLFLIYFLVNKFDSNSSLLRHQYHIVSGISSLLQKNDSELFNIKPHLFWLRVSLIVFRLRRKANFEGHYVTFWAILRIQVGFKGWEETTKATDQP